MIAVEARVPDAQRAGDALDVVEARGRADGLGLGAGDFEAVVLDGIVGRGDLDATGPLLATWHQVAVTYNSTTHDLKIYQDAGTPSVASYSGGIFNSSATFRIGALANPSNVFDGIIDEVGFWKRDLTAAEIARLWTGGNPARPSSIP